MFSILNHTAVILLVLAMINDYTPYYHAKQTLCIMELQLKIKTSQLCFNQINFVVSMKIILRVLYLPGCL